MDNHDVLPTEEALRLHADMLVTTSIDRDARVGTLPSSYAQERLWFLQQLDQTGAAHNILASIRFPGALKVDVLDRALRLLADRNEILRTTFGRCDGGPLVVINASLPIPITVVEMAAGAEAARDGERHRIAQQELATPFDLERGPLMRACLIRESDQVWELLICYHQLIGDRRTSSILAREIAELCQAQPTGGAPAGSKSGVQYVDFAEWQRSCVREGLFEASLAYWRSALDGAPPSLDLPTDRPRPIEQSYRAGTVVRTLGPHAAEAVSAAGARLGVAPLTIFLAAFHALLHRYTGEDDILVGVEMPGRRGPESRGLIGCVDNAVVMRADLSDGPTFRMLLDRVGRAAAGAISHADVPFELLLEKLQPHRDLSRPPFFQVGLACEMAADVAEPLGPGADVSVCGGLLVDLTLLVKESNGRLEVTAEYNRDLFDRASIERTLVHYENLVASALAQLDAPIAALPFLGAGEYAQMVTDWNRTALDIGPAACVTQLVEAQAAATPDAIAVEFEGRRWSYAQLNRRANGFAEYLRAAGVGPETLVGVCVERSPEMLVALLGILKAGGAYLPLDPSYPSARLKFMLDDAGVSIVVTEKSLADVAPIEGRALIYVDAGPAFGLESELNPAPPASGDNLAYVIYTSGSTGAPKGVQVRRRALVNLLASMRDALEPPPHATLLSVTTLAFDIAGLELFLPLTMGARVVIVSRAVASDGRALIGALAESSATMMQATPATWRLLLEAGWNPPAGFQILCGGEALPQDLAGRLAALGETWNLYGPTETTIWSSVDRVSASGDAVTIGRPIGNTEMYVLDRALRPLPIGLVGELYIAGDGLARGYLGRAMMTAERFVPNPFGESAGERMYRTGDLARFRADGRIEWIDRVDGQVKIRGYRVELREIELALNAHASVKESVVFADREVEDRRLVAHVVFQPGESLTASELRRFARQSLPPYMVPSFFVNVDRLQLMLNGKIDRRALSAPFAVATADATRLPPRTPIECEIAAIWQRALGTDAVGVHDNFFDVGGHSLLSMRVLAEIERTLGERLSPRVMFLENLEQIAARCTRRPSAGEPADRDSTPGQAGGRS